MMCKNNIWQLRCSYLAFKYRLEIIILICYNGFHSTSKMGPQSSASPFHQLSRIPIPTALLTAIASTDTRRTLTFPSYRNHLRRTASMPPVEPSTSICQLARCSRALTLTHPPTYAWPSIRLHSGNEFEQVKKISMPRFFFPAPSFLPSQPFLSNTTPFLSFFLSSRNRQQTSPSKKIDSPFWSKEKAKSKKSSNNFFS